eukprot:COSAG05_NODE_21393_length_272_cov_0.601156_1_plen_57_part_01
MIVTQRPEHVLGYVKARLLEAFMRSNSLGSSSDVASSQPSSSTQIDVREALSARCQQ